MLKRYFYGLIITLFSLTPFIYSSVMMDGVNSSKQIWFIGVMGLLLLIFSITLFLNKNTLSLNLNTIDLTLLIFYFYLLIRAIFTEYPNFLFNTFLFNFTLLVLFYFIVKHLFNDKNGILKPTNKYIFILFLIIGLAQSILGILQINGSFPSFSYDFKITGTFINPAPYSLYLSSVFPFALIVCLFIKTTNIYTYIIKYISLLTILLISLILAISKIRTSWLSILLSTIIILFYKYNLRNKINEILSSKMRKGLACLLTIIFVISLSISLYKIKPSSTSGRFFIWEVTSNIIKENPIFGIGVGRFEAVYNNFQAHWFVSHQKNIEKELVAGNVKFAYNEYLELFSETGIIGLILFLILITYILIYGYRALQIHKTKILLAVFTSIISILACAIISYPFNVLPIFLLFFWYIAIISVAINKEHYYFCCNLNFRTPFKRNILAIFLLGFSILLLFQTKSQYLSYKLWKKADTDYKMGCYNNAREKYENIKSSFLLNNGEYLQYYGKCLSMNNNILESIIILEKARTLWSDPVIYITLGDGYKLLKQYDKAKENYLIAVNMIPHKLFPKYKLACLFKEMGNDKDFTNISREILSQKLKVDSFLAGEIKNEIKKMSDQP